MVSEVRLCQHRGSGRLVRNGCAPNGKQRYLCRDCGRQCRRHATTPGYSEREREQILADYAERSSLRGLQRTFSVAPDTVAGWLLRSPFNTRLATSFKTKACDRVRASNLRAELIKKARSLPLLEVTVVEPPPNQPSTLTLELDEVWSFVGAKWAPIWLWIALCHETRQVVAYALGDRSEATARQ